MSKTIAYIRAFTDKQDVQNQRHEILAYGNKGGIRIDDFIEVTMTSRKSSRKRGRMNPLAADHLSRGISMSPKIDDRNWQTLSLGEQIKQIEVEGYLVLPDLLSAEQLDTLRGETRTLETFAVDYSVHQQVCPNIQFHGGPITDLIAHKPTINFLQTVMGKEIILMSYAYARSEPGHPGISLHADGQPYGSEIFGYQGSCPFLIRVLYYLQDLTTLMSLHSALYPVLTCVCTPTPTLTNATRLTRKRSWFQSRQVPPC